MSASRRSRGRSGAWASAEKKDSGCDRTRRVLKSRLEDDDLCHRPETAGVLKDECSTNTSLAPLYGWSRRAEERVYQKAPRNWGKNITLLASITKEEGMGPCLTVEGATTKEVFETYNIEQGLAPTLRDGQVVVMDNLSSHKGERVKELLIEGRGCELCSTCHPTRPTSTPSSKR